MFFGCFQCSKAVTTCRRSLLEISNRPVELELLFDQWLTQALSYFLSEALLCLNILNILHVGPPPLSRCAQLTVLTLSNLQGGGPFPSLLPLATPSLLWLYPHLTFTHSTEVSPTFLLSLSGVERFSALMFFFASAWKSCITEETK